MEYIKSLTVRDLLGRAYSRDDFVFFWGHADRETGHVGKQCLSQWYIAPMVVEGVYYHCMEQYLMAEKARVFHDSETEAKIMTEYNQLAIRKLGRQVANFDGLIWGAVRQLISIHGNVEKFSQNERLKDYLLSTGDRIIVEASPYDHIWGIGLEESDPRAVVPSRWPGANLLGFALMAVRDRLREQSE